MKMPLNVLKILSLLAIYVAWKVEVKLVLLDLLKTDHPRVFRDLNLLGEYIHYFADILSSKAVFGPILHETSAGINHKDTFAALSSFFVDNYDTGRDTGTIEKVGWQTNNSLDVALTHQSTADIGFELPRKSTP